MGHALAERHFDSYEVVRKWLNELFTSKDEDFFWNGIHKLPEKCMVSDGKYFEWICFCFLGKKNVFFWLKNSGFKLIHLVNTQHGTSHGAFTEQTLRSDGYKFLENGINIDPLSYGDRSEISSPWEIIANYHCLSTWKSFYDIIFIRCFETNTKTIFL